MIFSSTMTFGQWLANFYQTHGRYPTYSERVEYLATRESLRPATENKYPELERGKTNAD